MLRAFQERSQGWRDLRTFDALHDEFRSLLSTMSKAPPVPDQTTCDHLNDVPQQLKMKFKDSDNTVAKLVTYFEATAQSAAGSNNLFDPATTMQSAARSAACSSRSSQPTAIAPMQTASVKAVQSQSAAHSSATGHAPLPRTTAHHQSIPSVSGFSASKPSDLCGAGVADPSESLNHRENSNAISIGLLEARVSPLESHLKAALWDLRLVTQQNAELVTRHRELSDQLATQTALVGSTLEWQSEYHVYEDDAETQEYGDWDWDDDGYPEGEDAQCQETVQSSPVTSPPVMPPASAGARLEAYAPDACAAIRSEADLGGHDGCDGHVGIIAGCPVFYHPGLGRSGPATHTPNPTHLPTAEALSGPVQLESADMQTEWPARGLKPPTGVATPAAPVPSCGPRGGGFSW